MINLNTINIKYTTFFSKNLNSKKSLAFKENFIETVSLDRNFDIIEQARKGIKTKEDWKSFIEWRNKSCSLPEQKYGTKEGSNVLIPQSCVTVNRYSVGSHVYQDSYIRGLGGNLQGYLSLSKPDPSRLRIRRVIAFDNSPQGTGTDLLQIASETDRLTGKKGGKINLKAESFTDGDPSPVGFYYKRGFRTDDKFLNQRIEKDLELHPFTRVNGVEMHLTRDGEDEMEERIQSSPILWASSSNTLQQPELPNIPTAQFLGQKGIIIKTH